MPNWVQIALEISAAISLIDISIMLIIYFYHFKIWESEFKNAGMPFIITFSVVPIFNLLSLYATIVDTIRYINSEKDKKFMKVKSLEELPISTELQERMNAIATMAALVEYDVKFEYRNEVQDTVEAVLLIQNKNIHHNLYVRCDRKKIVRVSLDVVERGTNIHLGTDDLEKALQLIEWRM